MNIGQQIAFFISALGAFNGVVLGLYFFLQKKRSATSVLLGIMLLAISLRVAKSVLFYFEPSVPPIPLQLGLSAGFFIGPAVYYFFRSAMGKPGTATTVSVKWVWAGLIALTLIVGLLFPYQTYPDTWNKGVGYVIYWQWAGFLIASAFLLKPVIAKFFKKAVRLSETEKFWLLILAGNGAIYLTSIMPISGLIEGICFSGAFSFSLVLYLTIFFYLNRAKMENILQMKQTAGTGTKPERRRIPETDAQTWVANLEKIIVEKQLYKDPNLKLSDLAQKIHVSSHQLSLLLNENLNKSFSTYINEYRINEACKLISRDTPLSLEAIGYEVGFNSKSTFYTAFRKLKDTTPALYKESLVNALSR